MSKMLDRTGEYKVNTQGIGMTIIEYRSCNDITVQFDNGAIVNTKMHKFNSGQVRCKNAICKIGEISQTKDGKLMELIAYRSGVDIDIRFEDGKLRRGIRYDRFKCGRVAYTNYHEDRIGEKNVSSNGMKMTIVKYRSANDIDVEFEDGTVARHRAYQNFKTGHISKTESNINDRTGEIGVNNQGYEMKIITYRRTTDIDVQFEDGAIVKHKSYNAFIRHKIAHPSYKTNKIRRSRIGENSLMTCEMLATIINYRNCQDMDVKLEDGSVVYNTSYALFLKGSIVNPKYSKCEHVATFNNKKYFLCTCKKCRSKHMLCIDEMKNFECEA